MNRRIALYILIGLTILALADSRYGWLGTLTPYEDLIRVEGFEWTGIPSGMPSVESSGSLEGDLAGGDVLKVSNQLGDIKLEGLLDTTVYSLDYTIYIYAEDKAVALEYLPKLGVKATSAKDGIEVSLVAAEGRPRGVYQVRLDISGTIPSDARVEIHNGMGEVQVMNIKGPSLVENRYKNTSVKHVDGNLDVHAPYSTLSVSDVFGDLDVGGSYGQSSIRGISGNVIVESNFRQTDVESVGGSVSVGTKYGNVVAADIGGDFTAEGSFATVAGQTIGGDAKATTKYGAILLEDVGGDVTIDAKYSNVNLTLGTLDHHLTLEVQNGDLVLRGALATYKPTVSNTRKTFDEIIGGGTSSVRAKNVGGNIAVIGEHH